MKKFLVGSILTLCLLTTTSCGYLTKRESVHRMCVETDAGDTIYLYGGEVYYYNDGTINIKYAKQVKKQ